MADELSAADLRAIRERRKLFIGGLNFKTSDVDLHDAFVRFGRIESSQIMKLRENGRSRGFGFVIFEESRSAEEALRAMDQNQLDGRKVRVDFAQSKADSKANGLTNRRPYTNEPPPPHHRDMDQRGPPPQSYYGNAAPRADAVYQGERGGTYGSGYQPRSYQGPPPRVEAPRYEAPQYATGRPGDPYARPPPREETGYRAPYDAPPPQSDFRGGGPPPPRDGRGGYDRRAPPEAARDPRDVRSSAPSFRERPPAQAYGQPQARDGGRGPPPPVGGGYDSRSSQGLGSDRYGNPPQTGPSYSDSRSAPAPAPSFSEPRRPAYGADRFAPPADRAPSYGRPEPSAYGNDPRGPPPGDRYAAEPSRGVAYGEPRYGGQAPTPAQGYPAGSNGAGQYGQSSASYDPRRPQQGQPQQSGGSHYGQRYR
eukprot:m.53677 g.53677  ORF g.53677 m.53677 type:complete len:424 (+) comp13577_c0_seq2:1345-2616(+)